MSWARLSDVVLAYPGYFTGRTALAYWGVSLEFDVPIQVATTVTDAERDGVLYVWMPDDMYFGFVRREGVLIATPEKALVDGWLIEERLGVYPCDPDDVLWEELDPEALAEIVGTPPKSCGLRRVPTYAGGAGPPPAHSPGGRADGGAGGLPPAGRPAAPGGRIRTCERRYSP